MNNNVNQKQCYFCKNNIRHIDYKETDIFRRYLTNWSRIKPGVVTGVCVKHQKQLTNAIKRARFLALIPFVSR
jgi:small subunit ribosomal protein S18